MSTESEPDILYHYCSNDAFLKIVENKCIWLSDLSLSNDSEEGKWVRRIFRQCFDEKRTDESISKNIDEAFDDFDANTAAIGFCLSADHGDRLSQWRGYADDGAGVAIGFDRNLLQELIDWRQNPESLYRKWHEFIKLHEVIYDEEKTKQDVDSIIRKSRTSRIDATYEILDAIYTHKNHAFKEEQEWRLILNFRSVKNGVGYLKEMEFRSRKNSIVPYYELKFTTDDNPPISKIKSAASPIKRIVLGPKNGTPKKVVEGFLAKHGHENVEVVPSAASYR